MKRTKTVYLVLELALLALFAMALMVGGARATVNWRGRRRFAASSGSAPEATNVPSSTEKTVSTLKERLMTTYQTLSRKVAQHLSRRQVANTEAPVPTVGIGDLREVDDLKNEAQSSLSKKAIRQINAKADAKKLLTTMPACSS
jgi:hypothetical protein